MNFGLKLLAAMAAGICMSLAGGASAQTTIAELDRQAKAALRPLTKDEQFSLASGNCLQNLDLRNRDPSRVWCAQASKLAVSRIDKTGLPSAEEEMPPEVRIVRKALWMSAVDGLGLQNDPWWGSPRSETIPMRNELRRLAYVVVADFNRDNTGLLDFNL
jgi:hypothetical protein